ncbi:hypothetical protein M413DRAFT_443009, partial [Hebeloma cylindrosporum]
MHFSSRWFVLIPAWMIHFKAPLELELRRTSGGRSNQLLWVFPGAFTYFSYVPFFFCM